jgi:hypothetical protein
MAYKEAEMSDSDIPRDSQTSFKQDSSADVRRREALIKLGKYTAYATPILLATVTAAEAVSAPAPAPPAAPPPAP